MSLWTVAHYRSLLLKFRMVLTMIAYVIVLDLVVTVLVVRPRSSSEAIVGGLLRVSRVVVIGKVAQIDTSCAIFSVDIVMRQSQLL